MTIAIFPVKSGTPFTEILGFGKWEPRAEESANLPRERRWINPSQYFRCKQPTVDLIETIHPQTGATCRDLDVLTIVAVGRRVGIEQGAMATALRCVIACNKKSTIVNPDGTLYRHSDGGGVEAHRVANRTDEREKII